MTNIDTKIKMWKLNAPRGFPGDAVVKHPAANAGDAGLMSGLERSPGGGNSNLLQYSWWTVPWTVEPGRLQYPGSQRSGQDWACTPEKAMAPHASALAWRVPWMEEPGGLQSMGSLEVKTRLSNFTFTFHFHALEKEMATHSSVLAWGESQRWGSLVGCRLWDHTESDTTEAT